MTFYFLEFVLPLIRTKLRNYAIEHPRAYYESIVCITRGPGSSHRALLPVNVPVSFRDSRNRKKLAFQKTAVFTALRGSFRSKFLQVRVTSVVLSVI